MQERHLNSNQYFNEQGITTEKFVIPFIRKVFPLNSSSKILEIGCGEAGNLKPFLDMGCTAVGIDLDKLRIENGKLFFKDHPHAGNLTLIAEDIYKVDDLNETFDVIIIRDVIEHIPDQERFLGRVKSFLAPGGVVFIAFPPWQNPFGGHQQICRKKFVSHCPWLHLLPRRLYLSIVGKDDASCMSEIRDTRISLERFYRIVRKNNFRILEETLYFINPNYETKFNLRPRRLWKVFNIPYLRNFYTTCGYFLIG